MQATMYFGIQIFFTITIVGIHEAMQLKYVSQLCPGNLGPTHGDVLTFDPNDLPTSWVIPGEHLDCWVTLRGFPDASKSVQMLSTLSWRSDFVVQGYDTTFDPEFLEQSFNTSIQEMDGCENGYVEIFDALEDGTIVEPAVIGPLCGQAVPVDFTTSSNMIIVHLFIHAPPPGTYTLINGSVIEAYTSCGPNVTKTDCVHEEKRHGPFVTFKADFTSYFEGDCSADGEEDDEDQMYCGEGTNRCIHASVKCDSLRADNCGDGTDQSTQPPANCGQLPPGPWSQLLPLWITLASLLGAALLYWCCWKTAWLPWRLACCRNHASCKCCLRPVCCRQNGLCGPLPDRSYRLAACRGCTGYMPWEKRKEKSKVKPSPPKDDWRNYAYDDGAHVRENR